MTSVNDIDRVLRAVVNLQLQPPLRTPANIRAIEGWLREHHPDGPATAFPRVFLSEWPVGTGIDWWDQGRAKLNVVIVKFNDWMRKRHPERAEAESLQILIGEALQTWAGRDGGGGWVDDLLQMRGVINDFLERTD